MRVDRPISQGFIITYAEVPEEELIAMAKNITLTSKDAREDVKNK